MAHHNQRNLRVEIDRRVPDTMTSITTHYFKNIQKLRNYIQNLETKTGQLESWVNSLQERDFPVKRGQLLDYTETSTQHVNECITINHCLLSMFDQMYSELLHSLHLQNEALREKKEEYHQLQLEREAIAQRLQQKEETFEELNIKYENMNEEMLNLQEYKEDTSTKLIVMQQEFVEMEELLQKYKSETEAMRAKFVEQKEEIKCISMTNQQLSGTLAENAVVFKQMANDAQTQAMYIQELQSMRIIKEDINEQLQKELERSRNKSEQLERDNWALVNSLTDMTRQYQISLDKVKNTIDDNSLLKSRVSFLETSKEKLEADLWKSNRMLDKTEQALGNKRAHSL